MTLVVDGVSMRYRSSDHPILADVSFQVRAGEVVPLLGANGAGKTTLLRLVAGLVHPSTGRVLVGGQDVVRSPGSARQKLGLSLYPERSFYYRLTCRQNLVYFASLHHLFGATAQGRVAQALDAVGLQEQADVAFMRLSLGQRKRLGAARCLLARPALLVLDEPTANLDADSCQALHEVLAVCAGEGCAVLLSTHRMEDLAYATGGHLRIAGGAVAWERSWGQEGAARWVEVVVADPGGVDLSSLDSQFVVRHHGDRLAIELPVSMSISALVGTLDSQGVTVAQVNDCRQPAAGG